MWLHQLLPLVAMPVIFTFGFYIESQTRFTTQLWRTLTRRTVDRVVNPQQGYRGLECGFQAAYLAHCRLKYTCSEIIPNLAIQEIKSVSHQLAVGISRRRVLTSMV